MFKFPEPHFNCQINLKNDVLCFIALHLSVINSNRRLCVFFTLSANFLGHYIDNRLSLDCQRAEGSTVYFSTGERCGVFHSLCVFFFVNKLF